MVGAAAARAGFPNRYNGASMGRESVVNESGDWLEGNAMHGRAKRWMSTFFMAAFAHAAFAKNPPAPNNPPPTTSVTVDQLDKLIAFYRRLSDGKAAQEIAGEKLTERASAARVAQWETAFPDGHAREALVAVVDASAFLNPPVAEVLSAPPPDAALVKQILQRAIEYASKTVLRMPNFTALRSTTEFELTTDGQMDTQYHEIQLNLPKHTKRAAYHELGPAKLDGLPDAKLFWMGSLAEVVTSRGGVEVADSSGGDAALSNQTSNQASFDLRSTGEFGPILATVLGDASRSKIRWDHWEQNSTGRLAIFRYEVPSDKSRFAVQLAPDQEPEYPAYHGEIAVEPASGSVFRTTMVASTSGNGFVSESSVMVEFGPAQIAGISYICPLRGVTIARYFDPLEYHRQDRAPTPYRTSINDISFTDFHVFRSESRVLPGANGP
jgi:hypothetical protein